MDVNGPMPPRVRASLLLLAVLTLAYAAQVSFILIPRPAAELYEKATTNLVALSAALLCAYRAVRVRDERVPWACLAAGLGLWGLGDVYYAIFLWDLKDAPVPSPADIGYLGLYPFAFAGLVLLYRAHGASHARSLWVDGAVGALALTALGSTLLYSPLSEALAGSTGVITNLAYPLGDLLLLGLLGGVVAMTGGRLHRAWTWIAAGLAVFAACDSLFAYTNAVGTYGHGRFFDAGWPIGALMIARAAWLPAAPPRAREDRGWSTIALALVLAGICLALLVYDHFGRVNLLSLVLATTALVAVLVRLAITFGQNLRMLQASRHEALTDGLTGLRNRRALMLDLDRVLAGEPPEPVVLGVFDLDGFKQYNDAFGHPAGDALLARLGAALQRAVTGSGRAYRLGGDEFCIIASAADGDVAARIADAGAALTERGEAFAVGCSYGSVLVPDEADSAATALKLADQRMYAHKQGGRPSAVSQSKDVLRQALSERHPDIEPHVSEVAEIADAVARRLGLADADVAEVRLAAELHDVGKVAIPEIILYKAGPLDETEWAYMRRHTIIGERIVAAAPALASVARIVRSSHERVDGAGYPDGLSGSEIPLAARIVFASDAFAAMTSDRPYSRAIPASDALAELRRCAGSQFDPMVVEAVCGIVDERELSRLETAAPAPA
jgi:two-component system cell cycle response regulator